MKRLIYTIAVLFTSCVAFAQQSPCGTDQMFQELIRQDPAMKQKFDQYNEAFAQFMKNVDLNQFKAEGVMGKTSTPHYIIPVVFHVLHNNGYSGENIVDQKIFDEVKIMNWNYNAQSPFRSRIRPIFKDLEANVNIEFRLARIDPQGNVTNGIDRVYVGQMTQKGNDNLKKNTWDPQHYLNIWVCSSIRINSAFAVGGYAYKPATGVPSSVDGPIILSSTVGQISSPEPFDYNTAGHEVGHYLGLDHPFNGDSCALDGDYIYDTPPRFFTPGVGHFNGVSSQNFCSNPDSNTCSTDNPDLPDQTENFMDYFTGSCSNSMFTLQQAARMHFTLENYRRNLWQPENLKATGTDTISTAYTNYMNGLMIPKALFSVYDNRNNTDVRTCVGAAVNFRDNSINYVSSVGLDYQWDFGDGASPATSTVQNPNGVTYSTPGYKTVTLTVNVKGDATRKNTLTYKDYIYIEGPADVNPAYKAFTADWDYINDFLQKGWYYENEMPNGQWKRVTSAYYRGCASLELESNNTISGFNYSIISPPFDFSTNPTSPYFELYYAFAPNYANPGSVTPTQDALSIMVSTDCGKTWTSPKIKVGGNSYEANQLPLNFNPPAAVSPNPLGTTNISHTPVNSSVNFYPVGDTQWVKMTVPSSGIPKVGNVKFKIQFSNGGGNNLYLDNIALGLTTGIQELTADKLNIGVYPNPFNSTTSLTYTMPTSAKVDIRIYDIVGKEVGTVFTGTQEEGSQEIIIDRAKLSLNSGLYFVRLNIDGTKGFTQKVLIN